MCKFDLQGFFQQKRTGGQVERLKVFTLITEEAALFSGAFLCFPEYSEKPENFLQKAQPDHEIFASFKGA